MMIDLALYCMSRASAYGRSQLKRQKLRVGGYTEGSTIPAQGPTPDAKLAAMQGVPNRLASSLRPCFVEASLTVEKAVSCYKADRLVASLTSFRSVRSSLAVRKFCTAVEDAANEAADGCVRTFDAWCCGAQSASEQSQLCELSGLTFRFTIRKKI